MHCWARPAAAETETFSASGRGQGELEENSVRIIVDAFRTVETRNQRESSELDERVLFDPAAKAFLTWNIDLNGLHYPNAI